MTLEEALEVAAEFVALDKKYLPIYDRLEREFALARQKDSSLERALAMANKIGSICGTTIGTKQGSNRDLNKQVSL